jgi:two-component system cell cycle response regulator
MALQTALVVDDSKLARITLQRLLEKHNLSVHSAESGIQAMDLLKTLNPDVIFMDHLMPELDGFETTQKIKADPRLSHIPVIMCSGKEGVDNYEEQAIAIGASGILSKPPQPDKLLEALTTAEKSRTAKPVSAPVQAPVAADTQFTVDLAALLGRIEALERRPLDIPSFDGFQQKLQENSGRIAVVEEQSTELAQQINGLGEECSSLETSMGVIGAKLESLSDSSHLFEQFKTEWKSGLEERIKEAVTGLVPEPVPAVDEENLAGRIARDVENTLTPLLEDELRTLEERMMRSLDEAVSESRKDLDASLADQIKTAGSIAVSAKNEAAVTDPSALFASMQDAVVDIATRTVTAAIDTRMDDVEDRLQTSTQSTLDQLKAQIEARFAETLTQASPAKASVSAGEDDEAMATRVEAAVKAHFHEEGDTLVNDISSAISLQIDDKQRQIDELRVLLNNALEQTGRQSQPNVAGRSMGGGTLLAIGAIVVALIALARSFGLF